MINLTREQAIKIILNITNQDDPYWEYLVEEFYDEQTDTLPTIYDVLYPLGVSKKEIDNLEGYNARMGD